MGPTEIPVNIFVLLGSAVTLYLGVRAVHQNRQRVLRRWLGITLILGTALSSPSRAANGSA